MGYEEDHQGAPVAELRDVAKRYRARGGPVAALDGVSLSVEPGEVVGVVGPSGSGKTTLLLLLGAMLTPTSGSVLIGGADVGRLGPRARAGLRRRSIGFVFQMFHLLPYLTARANVRLAAPGGDARVAGELLERVGLADRADHRPPQLSAGERQRVAIARAMAARPSLLLADEPTGNLDGATAAGVLDLIASFREDGGGVVLATHAEAAADRADRVIRLDRGRVVEPAPAGGVYAGAGAAG